MARARIAAVAASVLILALRATAVAAPAPVAPAGTSVQAVVAWPASTGLLVAEVVTGGASASDEYVELTNAASSPIDLAGIEVAYVTGTGSTVTRKASWASSTPIGPGRHLLIANGSGIYAADADATYSGGFAATGGAIVLRPIGGQPIDAVGWGDASSAFVEGTSAPAPEAGSSIERRPGGAAGCSVDTNDNAADFILDAAPVAQNLASAPAPSPSPSPTAVPSPTPTTGPTPTPSAAPIPTPTPPATPTLAPTATPTVTPHPTPIASASPAPSPSPVPSDAPMTVGAARTTAVGETVVVRGVVVAEPGRLGSPPLLAIADQTGGVAVKLPDGIPDPSRGVTVEVRGTIADPYGQVEIRPASDGFASIGTGTLPAAIARPAGSIGENDEGRLVRVSGTIDASAGKSTSNDLSISITGADGGTLRIFADASSGLEAGLFRKGATVTLTGVVGQRASRKGALDGYRLWLRDRADVVITAQPAPTATPRGAATPTPKPGGGSAKPGTVSVRNALLRDGQRVTVEGTVTVGTDLLDASGRRTIVEDGTAAIEVYLAAPDATLKPGARMRVTGTVGQAWGAPRLRADEIRVVGSRRPSVHAIRSAPTAAVEWRLVKVSGTIAEVHRNGDRWTADLQVGDARVLISGLAGSGVASTDLVEGRSATITGIVKRPYPTATDRRFAIVPRQRGDVALGRAAATGPASPPAPGSTPAPGSSGPPGGILGPDAAISGPGAPSAIDIDLVDLAAHAGQHVRVGGLVTAIEADGVRLDDGTAEARLVLVGDAAGLAGSLVVGDALNAIGLPELRDEPVLVVSDQDGIELVGDLEVAATGGAVASGDPATGGETAARPEAPMRAVASPGLGIDPFSTGLGTLVLLGISSVGVALARRQRARRLFRARIVARLEAIGRGAAAPAAGPDPGPEQPPGMPIGTGTGAELGPNVRGSA